MAEILSNGKFIIVSLEYFFLSIEGKTFPWPCHRHLQVYHQVHECSLRIHFANQRNKEISAAPKSSLHAAGFQ